MPLRVACVAEARCPPGDHRAELRSARDPGFLARLLIAHWRMPLVGGSTRITKSWRRANHLAVVAGTWENVSRRDRAITIDREGLDCGLRNAYYFN